MYQVINGPLIRAMQKAYPNLQFFIYKYRGYADSQGRPTMEALRSDAGGALRYLHQRQDFNTFRLVLFGHGLGGAIACELFRFSFDYFKGVILSNTFMSMREIAKDYHLSLMNLRRGRRLARREMNNLHGDIPMAMREPRCVYLLQFYKRQFLCILVLSFLMGTWSLLAGIMCSDEDACCIDEFFSAGCRLCIVSYLLLRDSHLSW